MVEKQQKPDIDCAFELPSTAENHSCPAVVWIWLINSFLNKLKAIPPKELEQKFSVTLQDVLEPFFPGVDVFWAPAKEKSSVSELHHRRSREENGDLCELSFRGAFNSVLADLNSSYHSQSALSQLSLQLEKDGIPPSYVYWLSYDQNAICLRLLHLDDLESEGSGQSKDVALSFNRRGFCAPNAFYEELETKYSDLPLPENRPYLEDEIRAYIEGWSEESQVEPASACDLIEKSELLRATKHLSLMTLFMAANKMGGCSYFLAPGMYSRHDSTMVIYWPVKTPDRNLHYLLQLMLKLNSFPLILEERFRENVQAQKHNIGNLNPLGSLGRAIKVFEKNDLEQSDFEYGLSLINEAYKKLSLLTVSLDISFGLDLSKSKLSKMGTFKDFFDFLLETREQSNDPAIRTVNPVVKYTKGSESISVKGRKVDALFNCLWNLWHNTAKRYDGKSPEFFWVVLSCSGSFLDISFISEGEMKLEAVNYLLGHGPYPKDVTKKGKGGLEIVKDSLAELSAEVKGVYVAGEKTNVKVRFSC